MPRLVGGAACRPWLSGKPIPMGMNEWTGQTLLAADAGIAPGARGRGEDASEEGAEQAGGLGGRGGAEQAVCVCVITQSRHCVIGLLAK